MGLYSGFVALSDPELRGLAEVARRLPRLHCVIDGWEMKVIPVPSEPWGWAAHCEHCGRDWHIHEDTQGGSRPAGDGWWTMRMLTRGTTSRVADWGVIRQP